MALSGAPDRWLVLEIPRPADEESAGLFVELLTSLSGRGVEERGRYLIAYFEALNRELEVLLADIRDQLRDAASGESVELVHRWQAHEDWVQLWRDGLGPRRLTERLVVSPTWESPQLRAGDLLVSLDPGMAFGTAEHPTTRGCLRLLDRFVDKGQRIADIGSGSGILSIAAALLGADRVVAVDADSWAYAAARENAEANGVGDRIEVVEASVGPEFLPDHQPFDGVVAKIEVGVLSLRLGGFRAGIRPGGWLILGGVLEHKSDILVQTAQEIGFELSQADVEERWWAGGFSA